MGSLSSAIDASASALDVQRARMEVAVSNLANADSTSGPNGEPYRRREVLLQSTGPTSFGATLDRVQATGVKVAGVVEDQSAFRRRFEPGHPDADAEGYVAMPNVDVPEEMVNMIDSARAYQANLSAISLVRDTIQRSLDLVKS